MRKLLPFVCSLLLASCATLFAADAWTVLTAAMGDKNDQVRVKALIAMSGIGLLPKSVAIIEKACTDSSEEVRETAARLLGEMKSSSSIPVLEKMLDDSPSVAFSAAQALWLLKDYRGRVLFAAVLEGDRKTQGGVLHVMARDAHAKMHDRGGLVLMGVNAGVGSFMGPFGAGLGFAEEMFKDKGAVARALSASILAKDTDPASLDDLRSALDDKSPAVRAAAAKALGERGDTGSVQRLQTLLDDKHVAVQLVAAAAIIRIQNLDEIQRRKVPRAKLKRRKA
jgi:HEAT repeat protein